RVAVVTGASRGLGAAITRALLAEGATVYGLYRDSDAEMAALAEAARTGRGVLVPCKGDAANAAFCAALRSRVNDAPRPLHLLVCNAPAALRSRSVAPSVVARLNAFVADSFALTSVPLAHFLDLVEEAGGAVALVSSSAVETPPKVWPHYVAAKF